LLDAGPSPAIWGLSAISGIAQCLVEGQHNGVGADGPALLILLIASLGGAVWGVVQLHLLTALLYLVGLWTRGPATFRQLRTVIAWAAVPQAVVLVCWLVGTAVFGRLLYLRTDSLGSNPPPTLAFGMFLIGLTTFACALCSFGILVQGLAEAQGVSAWKATGSIIGAVMLGVVVLLGLVMIVMGVMK
jgi:hypothetical protein